MEMRSPDAFPDIDTPCRADDIGPAVENQRITGVGQPIVESAERGQYGLPAITTNCGRVRGVNANRPCLRRRMTQTGPIAIQRQRPGGAPRRDHSKADINSVLMPSTQTFSKVSPCCALARFADERQPEAGVHSGLIGKKS